MHVVRRPSPEAAEFSLAVVHVDPSQAWLTAAGELDVAAAEDLAAILTAQGAAGRTFIRLDLSGVTFIDCACLGVLVGALHRQAAIRGDLLLTNPSNPVLRLLTLTGLTESLLTSREPERPIGAATSRRIRLAVVDDHAVVVAGVASFLADEHIDVVEIGASRPVVSDVDIVLFDTFGQVEGEGDWPGRAAGLSSREAEIIALITQGLSNQDIADRVHLSINSIKSNIRTAYRKMHVTTRSQAVLWGVENGFQPDSLRTLDPALLVRPATTTAPSRPIP